MKHLTFLFTATLAGLISAAAADPTPVHVTIHGDQPGKPVSPLLYGIFFEDINYAADGGLYAELVQNRSFEYYGPKQPSLFAWETVERQGMTCKPKANIAQPMHVNNPTYVTLILTGTSGEAGLANLGYDGGLPLKQGATYDFSIHARRTKGEPAPLRVALEAPDGTVLGRAEVPAPGTAWKKLTATLTPTRDEPLARLVVTCASPGELHLDMVSLFPRDTFKGRPNGLRKDLAQAIADLQPKTVRFPGGCIVHGNGLANAYRWKDTVGDVAQRRPNNNRWGYHQTYGLGYFEYMQFCEDIGATPVPILPVGVSCGFHAPFQVAVGEALQPWIQDVIDLVEFANGPVSSKWGRVRADMGHPAPFGLKMIGLGNEEHDTEAFRRIFPLFADALRAQHPEIQIVGTSGLGEGVPLFDLMKQCRTAISDEHYYNKPEWFLENHQRFDTWPRTGPKIYVGEYAARGNSLFNALAEAAYLTGIERNADHVIMTAYAPLLARYKFTQWNQANLIHFNDAQVVLTPNYHVQRLFGNHLGNRYLPNTVTLADGSPALSGNIPLLAVSPTLAESAGRIYLKLVNPTENPLSARIEFKGLGKIQTQAEATVMAGAREAANNQKQPDFIAPVSSPLAVGSTFTYAVPPMSVQIINLRTEK
jgi:alpha-L-arabinofuranosidase